MYTQSNRKTKRKEKEKKMDDAPLFSFNAFATGMEQNDNEERERKN